jgi:hypothetical protein
MANFPALRPATVSITPGVVPVTLRAGYDGTTTTSTADQVASGDDLLLTFEGITEAQARSVPDHQRSQRGKSFGFDSITLATALTPAGFQWTYARPVEQDDIQAIANGEFYRLTVAFVGVWIRRASTPSASARIELRTTAAKALPAGTPSASTTLQLTTTAAGMATGTPSQSAFLLLITTPANTISTPLNDSLYGSVILHLPLTTDAGFTDVSGRALSITPQGNTAISTAQSRWGGGSAFFDNTGDWLTVALADAIGTSPYTIRFWFRPSSMSNDGLFSFTNSNGTKGGLSASVSNITGRRVGFSNSSSTFTNNLSACPNDGEWAFFQQTRAVTSNEVTTSVTVQGGSTSFDPGFSGSWPNAPRIFADNFSQTLLDIGLYFNNSYLFHGHMQDFQVTLAARPHTVPTGPLPIF